MMDRFGCPSHVVSQECLALALVSLKLKVTTLRRVATNVDFVTHGVEFWWIQD